MIAPQTRLSGFITYTTARPSARASAVKQAIGADYDFVADHYLRLRRAVKADRRGTRDGAAVAAAVANATPKKAASYTVLGKNWPKIARRWQECKSVTVDDAEIFIAGLRVLVRPSFAELHPDGALELVVMGYSAANHPADALDTVLRLVQRAYAQLHPEAVVTYVDLYTKRVRTSEGRDLSSHDIRIDTDAAGLAYAMRNAA